MSIGLGEAPAEPPRAVEVWPDSPDWRALAPLPDSVLLAEESWIAPPSALTAHRRLRDRHHFALPEGRVRVLLFETSSHWVAIETSVAAVRGPDGVWRLDQVKEVKDGAVAAEVEHVEWVLSPEHAARLDALLADACLAAEPLNTTYSPLGSSQQPRWVLDIQGPDGDLVIGGGDLGFGRAGALHHLLLAP